MDVEKQRAKNKKATKIGSIWSIFMYANLVDWLYIVLGVLGSVGDGFSSPLMFFLGSKLLNDFGATSSTISQSFTRNINKSCLALCYLAGGQWVASFIEGYCWTRVGERQARRMGTKYLKAVLRQDISYFDMQASTAGETVITLSNDCLIIQDALSEKIPNFLMNLSNFGGFYLVGLLVAWRLVVVGLPFVLFLVIPAMLYGRTAMKLAKKTKAEYSKANSIAAQAISSIRTLYAVGGERKTAAAYSAALESPLRLGLRQGLAKGFALGSNGVVFAIWSFLCYYGSRLVMYHHVEGGTVFVAGAGIIAGGLSFGSALSNMKYISEALSAAEEILEMVNTVPKIDSESMVGVIPDKCRGQVHFRNVKFAYPCRPNNLVLDAFNLKIEMGKKVALIGRSGSGKSTVIGLLQRLYDPLSGDILLDGVNISKLQINWWRHQMGLVSQEPALFGTSIKENILLGKEDASMEEVIEAAKASNAHIFISQLPQGYDTQVGEGGIQISGGQKQRIAIARAIIRNPKILLLDEATSALDSESEKIVLDVLNKTYIGSTTIVISHRLSTIRVCDVIAVIESGKVVECGSHSNLISGRETLVSSILGIQKMDDKPDQKSKDNGKRYSFEGNRSSLDNEIKMYPSTTATRFLQVDQERKPPVPSFWRLLALNLPELKQMLLGCLGATLSGGVHPVYTYTMALMVANFFCKDHKVIQENTRIYSLSFLALASCSLLSNLLQHYNFGYMGEHLTKKIRETMFSKILSFEIAWFDEDENSSGKVLARLASDANVVKSLVGDRMSLTVQTISTVITACTMGMIISWRLAIVMIAAQPLVICCIYTQRVLLKTMSKKIIKAQSETSKLAAESASNIRTVTAFCSQGRILAKLKEAQDRPQNESATQSLYVGIGLGTSNSLLTLVVVLSLWYGSKLMSHGNISAKELFQTYMILISMGRVVADAGSMTSDLAKGSEAVLPIFGLLDRQSTIEPEDEQGHQVSSITGMVELREVDFAYPSRPDVMILNKFSITIEAGKSTALVGQSGSGKSTIFALIERFYDPIRGAVQVDGHDIRLYNLRSLRRHMALVSQEPVLFSGSIKDNIAYGARDVTTEAEIVEAARIANAHSFINGMTHGYETLCGDKGTQLSGGQKQRIAIARAILRNPGLLLLDEATSALDCQSESLVQEALERAMSGRTNVIVAHKLSTIRNCDIVVVVDKGRVVEKEIPARFLAKKSELGARED